MDDLEAGSDLEARRARGIEMLTVRSLAQSLLPDEDFEDFVIVEYHTADIQVAALSNMSRDLAMAQGVDVEQTLVRSVIDFRGFDAKTLGQ